MRAKTLISIIGPTAVGKTALSIAFAKTYNTHIISCDSRQFYKEMTIGTAVPSPMEQASAPHHFIQNKSIHESFNVGDYEQEALHVIDDLFKKQDVLILVGGSMLYEKAITHGLDPLPEVPKTAVEKVQKEYEEKGLEFLQSELKKRDPDYYQKVDLNNPQRIIRALSLIRHTGTSFSSLRTGNSQDRNFQVIKVGLTGKREEIYQRMNQRVDLMFDNGLLEEAKRLYAYKDLNALQTVGYRELFSFLDNEYDLNEAKRLIKRNTRRFAKRQLTWYRGHDDIHWFNYHTCHKKILQQVHNYM